MQGFAKQEFYPDGTWSHIILERTRSPYSHCWLEWSTLPHKAFSNSSYVVEDSFLRKAEQLKEWLEFTAGLLERHEAWYARFALDEENKAKNYLKWRTTGGRAPSLKYRITGRQGGVGVKVEEGIPGVFWGNYFGPFYVNWFGREKFDDLPCVEKRWLDSGGIFFTTTATPFDWNTPAARQMQQAVKEHLGQDAFFDSDTVFARVHELEPIPRDFNPEQFQTPRRLPDFPFTVEPPRSQRMPIEEQLADARQTFEGQGYTLIEEDEKTLLFHDDEGGILRVTAGVGGTIEFLPGQERPTQRPQPTPGTEQPEGVSSVESVSKSASPSPAARAETVTLVGKCVEGVRRGAQASSCTLRSETLECPQSPASRTTSSPSPACASSSQVQLKSD